MTQGPPDQAPPDNVAFSTFTGIRNTVSAERLGPEELQRARNIDIDDAKQIHLRRGQSLVAAGNFHSLFEANDGTVYGVKSGATISVNKFAEDGSVGYHFGGFNATPHLFPANATVVITMRVKAAERTSFIIYTSNNLATPNCEFNLSNGTAGTPVGCTPTILPDVNGWYIASISFTVDPLGSSAQFLAILTAAFGSGFAGASYQGVLGDGILVSSASWTENAGPPTTIVLSQTMSGATLAGVSVPGVGSSLGIINRDYSFVGLQDGIGPDHLSYAQVGPVIYFSSLSNSGQITQPSNVVTPWGEAGPDFWFSPVVNPTPTLQPIRGRLFGSPPMATIVEYFQGRIYLANGRTVWATELYLYNIIDKTKNFWQFEDNVTMVRNVTDGLYIGTAAELYFLTGPTFNEMKRVNVWEAGVLPGTAVDVPSPLIDPQGRPDLAQVLPGDTAIAFMTTNGLIAGLSGGKIYNLTETRVLFPVAQTGSALFRQQDGSNQFIGVLDSGGSPAGNMRIGDYVSAQLIRSNGDPDA